MAKFDFKKEFKPLYTAPRTGFVLVEVPPVKFLMIDGMGDPDTAPEFAEAIDALYGIAYGIKFFAKKQGVGPEYAVAPLEGLWWCEGMDGFDAQHRDLWHWKLMIPQPSHVDVGIVRHAAETLAAKGRKGPFGKVGLETFEEGLCVQTLHVGPFSAEGPIIAAMHHFLSDSGLALRGKHHEIYLSDHRRTAPDKLRTILRQPVSRG